jgi:hypothetical protein
LLAVLLTLPVTATAQQRGRSGDRRSADRGADNRRSDDRQSEQRGNASSTDQRTNSFLGPIGLPPAPTNNRIPAWEQRQSPWWERQGPPAWEQNKVPSWEQNDTRSRPMNVARQMLNEERERRSIQKFGDPRDRGMKGRGHPPAVYYVLPPYRYFPYNSIYSYGVMSSTSTYVAPPPPYVVETTPPAPPEPQVTTGFLRLEVEPRELLQVFVDGFFVGGLADLGDEIELRLGPRRIELRAPGYRTLVFDTEIVVDRTIVYRGALERVPNGSTPPPADAIVKPAPAPGSRTIYVVPGCYVGNVMPVQSNLRAGCDISKLSKIEPQ